MSLLARAFAAGPAIVPFVSAGDPDPGIVPDIVVALARAGAGIVELGIPFSDPIADGPTIAAASQRALDRGFRPADVFRLIGRIRERSEVPLVLFTYCNPVFRYGIDRFLGQAAAAGANGLLMPDLPPEEAGQILASARSRGLDTVFLAAPTTPPARLERIARATSGFLYLVAALGVTGARARLADALADQVGRAKAIAGVPVAVGFGMSSPEQATQAVSWGADGVVVGSALVERLHQAHHDNLDVPAVAGEWIARWVNALAAAT